jgi:hypothetical protein
MIDLLVGFLEYPVQWLDLIVVIHVMGRRIKLLGCTHYYYFYFTIGCSSLWLKNYSEFMYFMVYELKRFFCICLHL